MPLMNNFWMDLSLNLVHTINYAPLKKNFSNFSDPLTFQNPIFDMTIPLFNDEIPAKRTTFPLVSAMSI